MKGDRNRGSEEVKIRGMEEEIEEMEEGKEVGRNI